jgi:hypothetical protein
MTTLKLIECATMQNCSGCRHHIHPGDATLVDREGLSFCAECVHAGLALVRATTASREEEAGRSAWSGAPPKNAGAFWVRPSPSSRRRQLARWEPKSKRLSLAGSTSLADARRKYPELQFWASRVRLPR